MQHRHPTAAERDSQVLTYPAREDVSSGFVSESSSGAACGFPENGTMHELLNSIVSEFSRYFPKGQHVPPESRMGEQFSGERPEVELRSFQLIPQRNHLRLPWQIKHVRIGWLTMPPEGTTRATES